MVRPCFLVIDREFAGSISTRKLVIETAKFNVITAYSSREAIATLTAYPAVDGAVLDAGMPDVACSDLIAALKLIKPTLPIVVVSALDATICEGADHRVESFDPANLLAILKKLQPEKSAKIESRNEQLSLEERTR